ncbi:YpiF family protein [Bacillus sp. Marseille-P3661]|uniref:YpiF family protein n=1 Tax=Bacillus sp. Marseille-P3661 TaxID=1936234 RepID=UPI000C82F9E0|nr:YpiF family protein [Bacillus sp. Marseille-P3661]
MKWTTTDMDMFLQAKEYVDTVVVPLVPITLIGEVKSTVEMGDYISMISIELERQFKGRLVMLPAFTYLKEEQESGLVERLNIWHQVLKEGGAKHIIYITADSDWKLQEKQLDSSLLWLPNISLENIDRKTIEKMISAQMKQVLSIIMNMWEKEEQDV